MSSVPAYIYLTMLAPRIPFEAEVWLLAFASCRPDDPMRRLTRGLRRPNIPIMATSSQLIGRMLGHYRIVEQIGAGGMGIVYRAHDEQLDREVALKLVPLGTWCEPMARSRFRKEALALARINHPNIATVHEFASDENLDYLVTEFIAGDTLEARLAGTQLTETQIIDIGLQLAHGLEAAHERGVIHRDLKPANLRFTENGTLKILDFGVATIVNVVSPTAATEPLQGSVSGTISYMAPEQLRGEAGDFRVDIWAAGAVLYQMVTCRPPFPETNLAQLIEAVLHHDPLPPRSLNPHISQGLDVIVTKCLDKDPSRRYQSARELSVDLLRLIPTAERSTVLETTGTRPPVSRWFRKTSIMATLSALLLIAFIGYAVYRHRLPRVNSRVLAVLPFHALSGDVSTEALGAGMAETLAVQLSQTEDNSGLQLVSIQEIADQGIKTADDARRQFGADLALLGSLQQSGPVVRINCSLVDTHTHRQVAARTITGEANDIFGLEDNAVSEMLGILRPQISLAKARNLRPQPPAASGAYEHYVRGRGYLQDYHKSENIESAVSEFRLAIGIDPKYALAYAGRGQAYLLGFEQMNAGNDWVDRAAQDCERSVVLSTDSPDAHLCLGEIARVRGQYAPAIEHLQRALELDHNNENALRNLAKVYEKLGDTSAAVAMYQKAIAARPQYWAGYNWLGGYYFRHAQYDDAIKMFRRVVELTPDNFRGHSNLGAVYVAQGRYSEALEELKRSAEIRPTVEGLTNLGTAYFALRRFSEAAETYQSGLNVDKSDWLLWGDFADALYWSPQRRAEASAAYHKAIVLAQQKLQVNPRDGIVLGYLATYLAMVGEKQTAAATVHKAIATDGSDPEVQFRLALAYLHLGQKDLCLTWLKKALETGYASSALRDTPDFDVLRSQAEFQLLLSRPNPSH